MNKLRLLIVVASIFASILFISAPITQAAKVFTDDDLKKFRPSPAEKSTEQEIKQQKVQPAAKPVEEPAKPATRNFDFYYDGAFVGVNVATMPGEKKINLTFQMRSKSLYICHRDLNITQKGRTISFAQAAGGDDSAKFSPSSGWEGCAVIYSGVTRSAVVGPLPEWFSFKESFSFNFRGRILNIDLP